MFYQLVVWILVSLRYQLPCILAPELQSSWLVVMAVGLALARSPAGLCHCWLADQSCTVCVVRLAVAEAPEGCVCGWLSALSKQHLWLQCGTVSLAAYLAAFRSWWLVMFYAWGTTSAHTKCCSQSCMMQVQRPVAHPALAG